MDTNTWLTESLDRLSTNSKFKATSAGAIARNMLESWNSITNSVAFTLDLKILDAIVTTAAGDNLDNIGKLVNVERFGTQYALGLVKIGIDSTLGKTLDDLKDLIEDATGTRPEDIILAAGTEISNENGSILYHTVSDVTLIDGDVYVNALCYLEGVSGNISSGVLNKFSSFSNSLFPIYNYLIVTNPNPIDAGSDKESDDNYRYRIINAFTASAKANEMSIRLAALSVPGVADVIMKRYAYGIGTTGVFVISESPIVSQGIVDAVSVATNMVCSSGEKTIASAPNYKAIYSSIVLEFKSDTPVSVKDSVCVQVRSNIVSYINNLKVNEEFVLHQLEQVILSTSNRIYDYVIQKMGIGDYNFDTGLIDYYQDVVPGNQVVVDMDKWVTNSKLVDVCY
jgi:uncharacterized phage protein gp47/JayE